MVTVSTQILILQVLEVVSIHMDQVIALRVMDYLTLIMVVITIIRVIIDLLEVTITLTTGVNIIIFQGRINPTKSTNTTKRTNTTRKRRSNVIMTLNVSSKAIHVAN